MILYQELQYSAPVPCPYLQGQIFTQAYFLADELDSYELDLLLATGWRKFGQFFFRPVCTACRKCLPVRIPVNDFIPSKSQRRLMRKNRDTQVIFDDLDYSDSLFELYKKHSESRFNKNVDRDEFQLSMCTKSCPSMVSKYFVNKILTGAGFLDRSTQGLSSVYYIFDPAMAALGLGNYSILREIQYAAEEGLLYYYLGYYVEGCARMEYKSRFYPYEYYDWLTQKWNIVYSPERGDNGE